MKPEYEKVQLRAANCCYEIGFYSKAVEYCDKLLRKHKEDKAVLEIRQKCVRSAKMKDRNARLKEREEKKELKEQQALVNALKHRGVNIAGFNGN